MSSVKVESRAFYIGTNNKLFSWWHAHVNNTLNRPCAVILCPPLGYEYLSVHRSFRYLANQLVLSGFNTFRFDYRFTGNSDGKDKKHLTLSTCIDDVVMMSDEVRKLSGCDAICCIGFGIGASIATLASANARIDQLVLWEPRVLGKQYLRELKAISNLFPFAEMRDQDADEAAGIYLSSNIVAELQALDIKRAADLKVKKCLLLCSEEKPQFTDLAASISAQNVACETAFYEGYADMVAFPTETLIPEEAIEKQISWLRESVVLESDSKTKQEKHLEYFSCQPQVLKFPASEEQCVSIGSKGLFGIYSVPLRTQSITENMPCIVFLNCGSEHHVGPHRIYTDFSRNLVALGYPSLRLDIEGIGDSPSCGNNVDNSAYSPCVLEDISTALTFLSSHFGQTKFVLTGICAGAYHSFLASSALQDYDIRGAILINPLVYHWAPTQSPIEQRDVAFTRERVRHKSSVLSVSAWLNLVVNPRKLINILKFYSVGTVNHFMAGLNSVHSSTHFHVRKSIQSIVDRKISVLICLGDKEPGLDLLRQYGGGIAKVAISRNIIRVENLDSTDHGLSRQYMRNLIFLKFKEFLAELS